MTPQQLIDKSKILTQAVRYIYLQKTAYAKAARQTPPTR